MISGKVPDPAQRERVIQIARSVQGVKEVQDSISVN
jgi:osmotically-inducible protein OsmY